MEIEKHIIKEGSRKHVVSYDSNGSRCSEPNCEINLKSREDNMKTKKEIIVLKNFIIEFNPLFNEETLKNVTYVELVSIAKEVAEGL